MVATLFENIIPNIQGISVASMINKRETIIALLLSFIFSTSRHVYKHTRRTLFVTHGYMSNGNVQWLHDIKNALLSKVFTRITIQPVKIKMSHNFKNNNKQHFISTLSTIAIFLTSLTCVT